jgi:hypothetical protein
LPVGRPSALIWCPYSGPPWDSSRPISTTPTNWNGCAWTVGTVGPVLTGALDNSLDAMIEEIFGLPRPELIARWRTIHEFFDEPRLASLLTTFGYA